jgi:hypothetical protein
MTKGELSSAGHLSVVAEDGFTEPDSILVNPENATNSQPSRSMASVARLPHSSSTTVTSPACPGGQTSMTRGLG